MFALLRNHLPALIVGVIGSLIAAWIAYGCGVSSGEEVGRRTGERDGYGHGLTFFRDSVQDTLVSRLVNERFAPQLDAARVDGYKAGLAEGSQQGYQKGHAVGVGEGQRLGMQTVNYLEEIFSLLRRQAAEAADTSRSASDGTILERASLLLDTSRRVTGVLDSLAVNVMDGPLMQELQRAVDSHDLPRIRSLLRQLNESMPARELQLHRGEMLLK